MDLYDLASSQHGVFSIHQLHEQEVSRRQMRTLFARGVIEPCLPGVYRMRGVGDTWQQRLSAATLWLPGSLASHRASLRLRCYRGFETAPAEVLVERWTRRHRPPHVLVHETKDLVGADIDHVDGIPCTSLVRTLVDVPAVVHEFKAGEALDQAMRRDDSILPRVTRRHREVARRGRDGTVKLRTLLESRGLADHKVDSGFERKALDLIATSDLPVPVTQHQIRDHDFVCYIDIAWPDQRIAMECDSLEFHLSEAAFRWERKRRRHLVGLGWTVLEFTYVEVTKEPTMVLRELRRHLAA